MRAASIIGFKRQREDQRTEAQSPRALRHRGVEHARRGREPERRRVVLGRVIGVEAAAIVGFDDLEPLLVEIVQREIIAVEVIENAEFHSSSLQYCW